MSIESADDLRGLRRVGHRPGLTTAELDGIGAAVFRRHGARPGTRL